MKVQYKAIFLKLTPEEHEKLSRQKRNFSSFYDASFTWEQYIVAALNEVNDKIKKVRLSLK